MKIIWIDGTFGIGKSAVAAAIVEEIPQSHLLEFDALQEKYKPTSVSDRFGKRYPEAKKYLVDALVDEITEIIQEGSCDCLVIPVALINLSNHYYDASRIDTSNMSIDSVAKEIIESITR